MFSFPCLLREKRGVPVPFALTCFILIAGFLAIGSCATPGSESSSQAANPKVPEPLLNSERIRQRFGSYGIDVVYESEQLRVSNLYSMEGGAKVMRTLALVIYPPKIPEPVRAEHAEIKRGHSIGEVFHRHGWRVAKKTIYIGEIRSSPEFAGVYAAMGGVRAVNLAVQVYQLSVARNGVWTDYTRIAEVHNPDYLDLAQLREISGEAVPDGNSGSIGETLQRVIEVMDSF